MSGENLFAISLKVYYLKIGFKFSNEWTEDELNKEVRYAIPSSECHYVTQFFFLSRSPHNRKNQGVIMTKFENWDFWQKNLDALQYNYRLLGRSSMSRFSVF